MTRFQPSPHDMGWLAERHRALVADLAGSLDLDTGLRDITVAGTQRSVAADLTETLDLDAGLNAILPVRESPATEPTIPPVSSDHPLVSLASLVNAIAAVPPATRLTLRAHTLSLVGAIKLVVAISEARRLARALADARRFTDIGELGHAGDLARKLDAALAHARVACLGDTSGNLNEIILAIASGRAQIGDLVRAVDLDRAILLAQARVESLALALARKISMARTMLIFVGSIEVSAASSLRDLVDNMTGADLHNVELTRITLDGVRWSDTTRWPARWAKHIRRNSVVLGDGVYEYRPGMTHIDNGLTLIVQ